MKLFSSALLFFLFFSDSFAATVLVANRNGSTVTEIDLHRGTIRDRIGNASSEPMYLSRFAFSETHHKKEFVVTGDRKNHQLIFSDPETGHERHRVHTSRGIFHQYSHPLLPNLVVVATDIDKGFDLIEYKEGKFHRRSFHLPVRYADGKPHDIVHDGKSVFLTVMLEKKDVLLQVDLHSFQVQRVRYFTQDTHLFSPVLSKNFFLLESATGAIHEISKSDLWDYETIYGPEGVHGVTGSEKGNFLVATDINASPSDPSIFVFHRVFGRLRLRATARTPHPVAHNLAMAEFHGVYSLFVTHSGLMSENVSHLQFNLTKRDLRFVETIKSGLNPFGILALP